MRTGKRKKIVIITLATLAFAITTLGVTTAMWFRYVSSTFSPFIAVLDVSEFERIEFESPDFRRIYPLLDYRNDSEFSAAVDRPRLWDFGGTVSVSLQREEYGVSVNFRQRQDTIGLALTIRTTPHSFHSITARVDRYGNLHPEENFYPNEDEWLPEWLNRHAQFNTSIAEVFAYARELFGENIFDAVN
ncbi:MAG: hypothetical protein FWC16_03305 [Defluviitaleaceae bacterium]|nr:hypothetical protein [Defluviitaleaceae bacterium]MCL2273930.1 hypothetical protein [Defluviitaleaceae bacterium]